MYSKQDDNLLIYLLALHLSREISYLEKQYLVLNLREDLKQIFSEEAENSFLRDLKKHLNLENSFFENRSKNLSEATKQLKLAADLNINIISIHSENYPSNLLQIPDYPICLYVLGNLHVSDNQAIAIVGSRKITNAGKKNAYALAYEAAKNGLIVVSGLAKGIDAEAHSGTLDAKGRTIAVLGSGIDYIYPKDNKNLYDKIEKAESVILTEHRITEKPIYYNFPKRNRIIAGLSLATIIIECREKSGALYTAEHALNYGRDVYAYPGEANSPFYAGNHKMIKQGAGLIENFQDLKQNLNLIMDIPLNKTENTKSIHKTKDHLFEAKNEILEENLEENLEKELQDIKKYLDNSENFNSNQKLIILLLLENRNGLSMDEIINRSELITKEVTSCINELLIEGYCKQEKKIIQLNSKEIVKRFVEL